MRCAPAGTCSSCGPTTCASPCAEAEEFLNGRLALELRAEEVASLVARTEGWPAALYLAALSLEGKEDKAGLVRAFDGTSAHVVEFLSSEVLSALRPGAAASSCCGRRRSSGCARSCATPCWDSPVPRRPSRSWPAATSSCSRSTTAASGSASITCSRSCCGWSSPAASRSWSEQLHRRAAAWHAASGTTDEAVHHALAAGAYADASALVAGAWVHYVNAGRTGSVLDWLARFPGEVVDADARLLLVQAWASALRGREHDMRRAIGLATERGDLEDGPLPDGFASLASSISVLRRGVRLGRRAA